MKTIRLTLLMAAMGMLSACAASPYYVAESKKAFLPARADPVAPGERRVRPDQPVTQTPVGWRNAARLDAGVDVTIIGKRFVFTPGQVVAMASVSGSASRQIPAGARIGCGEGRVNLAKNLLAASTLGITTVFNRTGNGARLCLIDTDADGRMDHAILAGVRRIADATPVAIAPTPFTLLNDQPMPGESGASILYRGKTGLVGGHISFDLSVVEGGTPLIFNNVRTRVKLADLPQRVVLMGAAFTVKSYDPVDGSILIDMENGFHDGNYGVHAMTTTQYIPIYVPR